MIVTTKERLITEIKCTISEYNAYINAKKWMPTTNVRFFKHTDGYVICDCKTTFGNSLIKIIIMQYFKNK